MNQSIMSEFIKEDESLLKDFTLLNSKNGTYHKFLLTIAKSELCAQYIILIMKTTNIKKQVVEWRQEGINHLGEKGNKLKTQG